ncbi:MAG: glycolate oxidase subunit GlcE [Aquabacterium sp.]
MDVAADPALAGLVDRVRAAQAARTPLCITGGGSKAFYGGLPRGEPLSTAGLSGISSYEPSELVVTARAGTPLVQLEAALAEAGQWLAFEPPRFRAMAGDAAGIAGGTVGGMVAAGLAGPGRMAAGGVRDHVLGLTMLNGRAEVLSFGGQVMKNVAGYDVSRLMAGSLGVLGVILEVSLKVLPRPLTTLSLRFECSQAQATDQLKAWATEPLPITATAWWSGVLVLRLAGAAAAVQAAHQRLGGEVVEPALAEAFWGGLRDHTDEFFQGAQRAVASGATLWRLAVPPTTPPLALPGEQLVEWHGGQRWVVTTAPAATLRDAAAAVGGHAVAFRRGQGVTAFAALSAPLARIQRQIKQAFDPDGLFNPGRLHVEW